MLVRGKQMDRQYRPLSIRRLALPPAEGKERHKCMRTGDSEAKSLRPIASGARPLGVRQATDLHESFVYRWVAADQTGTSIKCRSPLPPAASGPFEDGAEVALERGVHLAALLAGGEHDALDQPPDARARRLEFEACGWRDLDFHDKCVGLGCSEPSLSRDGPTPEAGRFTRPPGSPNGGMTPTTFSRAAIPCLRSRSSRPISSAPGPPGNPSGLLPSCFATIATGARWLGSRSGRRARTGPWACSFVSEPPRASAETGRLRWLS